MKLLNYGRDGGGGGCGGGIKLLNFRGGDGGGEKLLLLLLLQKLSPLCMSLISPGFGAFLTRSLAMPFFPISSSLSKEPTTGFFHKNLN